MARANKKVVEDTVVEETEVEITNDQSAPITDGNYVQDPTNFDDLVAIGVDEKNPLVRASYFGKLQSSLLFRAINTFAWDLNERNKKVPDEIKLEQNANQIARYSTAMWVCRGHLLACGSFVNKTPWSFDDAFNFAVANLTTIVPEITQDELDLMRMSRDDYEASFATKSPTFVPVAERLSDARDSVYNEIAGYREVDIIGAFSANEIVALCNGIVDNFILGYKGDKSRTRKALYAREHDALTVREHHDCAVKVEVYRNALMKSVQGTSRFADEF